MDLANRPCPRLDAEKARHLPFLLDRVEVLLRKVVVERHVNIVHERRRFALADLEAIQ